MINETVFNVMMIVVEAGFVADMTNGGFSFTNSNGNFIKVSASKYGLFEVNGNLHQDETIIETYF